MNTMDSKISLCQHSQPQKTIVWATALNSPWIGGAIGILVFLIIFGTRILHPTYIDWLFQIGGDETQRFVAWEFFKNEPWHFPPGVITGYGFPLKTSIVFMVTIPLFDLFFKIFSPILPSYFQYTGFWIAICYFLSGFFSWLIVSQYTKNYFLKMMSVLLFVLSPILFFRVSGGEPALSQWLILIGFYLYIASVNQRFLYWSLLIWMSALLFGYCLVMILGLWVAFLTKVIFIEKNLSWKKGIQHIFITFSVLIIIMWLLGYFILSTHGIQADSFGFYSMNWLAFMNPMGNSILLKDHQVGWGQYEGFNYFGMGMLLLAILALYEIIKSPPGYSSIKHYLPLIGICILLTIYALLPPVSIPLLSTITNAFRANGRFFWPVYYFIWILVFKTIYQKNTVKIASLAILSALLIQIIDFSKSLQGLHTKYTQTFAWDNPLKSIFWEKAARHYKHIIFIPAGLINPLGPLASTHFAFAHYAAIHGLTVNTGYFGRADKQKFAAEHALQMKNFFSGILDPDSLYIITDNNMMHIISPNLKTIDGVGMVDGLDVIAPKWLTFADYHHDHLLKPIKTYNYTPYAIRSRVNFMPNGNGLPYLLTGWSDVESSGIWSNDTDALLTIYLNSNKKAKMIFDLHPFLSGAHSTLDVDVWINGKKNTTWKFTSPEQTHRVLMLTPLSSKQMNQNYLVRFVLKNPMSPKQLGVSKDSRQLGIFLSHMTIVDR